MKPQYYLDRTLSDKASGTIGSFPKRKPKAVVDQMIDHYIDRAAQQVPKRKKAKR